MKAVHPCFQEAACATAARVHLPVAPQCNTACNFCNRKYDCPNEGRPGVASALLEPGHVPGYLREIAGRMSPSVIGIAGPGDPLANAERVFASIEAAAGIFPEASFCLATNGLALPEHARGLIEAGVGFVTVTVNAAKPSTGARIYRWTRLGKKILRGEDGAALMLENQLNGIRLLKAGGVTVKVNTVLIPGINEAEAPAIAELVKLAGADIMNILPMVPVEGTPFGDLGELSATAVAGVRESCAGVIPQVSHCRRCRADAAGTLDASLAADEVAGLLRQAAAGNKRRIAVASREGVLVNQHIGEAAGFLVYELVDGAVALVERREAPSAGSGGRRWELLAELLSDCRQVAATGVGARPRERLAAAGIETVLLSGTVAETARLLLREESYAHLALSNFSCSGGGANCA